MFRPHLLHINNFSKDRITHDCLLSCVICNSLQINVVRYPLYLFSNLERDSIGPSGHLHASLKMASLIYTLNGTYVSHKTYSKTENAQQHVVYFIFMDLDIYDDFPFKYFVVVKFKLIYVLLTTDKSKQQKLYL